MPEDSRPKPNEEPSIEELQAMGQQEATFALIRVAEERLMRVSQDTHRMTPAEWGKAQADAITEARRRLAAAYPDAWRDRNIEEVATPKARSGNDGNRKLVSGVQVPWPDEGVNPKRGEQRRMRGLQSFHLYDPSDSTPTENIHAYNMFRHLADTTAVTEHAESEHEYQTALDRLGREIFGEAGPELKTTEDLLHGESKSYDYHGQPIKIRIDPDAASDDFELYQWLGGPHEGDFAPHWTLRRTVPANPVAHVGHNERIVIPPEGVTLGREMTVAGFTNTQRGLSHRDRVSRQHVTLIPQEDGTIEIVDMSTNGTRVSESHWDLRTAAAEQ